MFSKQIVDSDAFLEMPLSTQALYFHLSMRADDDGFLNNAKKVMKIIGANQNDYDLLVAKSFVIQFPDGICVIKHWRINNYLRKDRYTETIYQEEKSHLTVQPNGRYSFRNAVESSDVLPVGIPLVDRSDTQNRIEKNREEKNSIYSAEKLHDEQSLDDFFESIWKLYPIKKGKGQVSTSRKKALQKIGYDQIGRCVDRFLKDMSDSGRDRKYWMHGSTFFNSGYVDYLDENWGQESEDLEKPREPCDRFSCLESSFRKQLEDAGAIYDGQGLDYGILSEHPDWLKKIQESGV
jgi:hypothetical protein